MHLLYQKVYYCKIIYVYLHIVHSAVDYISVNVQSDTANQ